MNPALFAIVLGALVVEATVGFGATVVTVTLASHLMSVDEVLAQLVPVNVLLACWFVARDHALVDWRLIGRRVAPGMGAGFALALLLGDRVGGTGLKAVFGAFVALLAVAELARVREAPPGRWAARAALFGAGVIHGLFSCGGPLLVWVVGGELPEKGRFRATLQAVWLVLGVLLLWRYAQMGTLTAASVEGTLWLLPALLLGVPIGGWVHDRAAPGPFRTGTFVVLLFAGGSLAVRSLVG